MTITEIIQGLEEEQKMATEQGAVLVTDVIEVCRLSVNLALHVQQLELELEMRKHPR